MFPVTFPSLLASFLPTGEAQLTVFKELTYLWKSPSVVSAIVFLAIKKSSLLALTKSHLQIYL